MYPYGDGWENADRMPLAPENKASKIEHHVDHFTGGVTVPLAQSAITGFVCGLAALVLSAWLKLPYWAIGGTVFTLAMAGGWLSYRGRWQAVLEALLQVDLNHSGKVGDLQPVQLPTVQALPETITVHLTKNEGMEGAFIPLPHPDKIPVLASTILEGRQFTQTALVTGKILSREEYEDIKTAMLNGGLWRYKNPDAPNAGIVCTAAGRAVLRRFLPEKTTPPLLEDDEK